MAKTTPEVTYACDGKVAEHWLKHADTDEFCYGKGHPNERQEATRKFEDDESDEPVFLCDSPVCAAEFGPSTPTTPLDPEEGECGHCGGRIRRRED